ncbi:MAG: S41 family peptidase [Promethearchaeota archaeon]
MKEGSPLIIDIRGNPGGSTSYWEQNIVEPLLKRKMKAKEYLVFRKGAYVNYFRKAAKVYFKKSKSSFDYLPPEVLTDDYELYKFYDTYGPSKKVAANFTGQIILLTDKNVYSASEAFAAFCKQTGFTTIYGTHTGGDGIGMHPAYFVLPNSKLVIRMPPAIGINNFGFANEEVHTEPDVYYESTLGNWTELIDYTINNLKKSI